MHVQDFINILRHNVSNILIPVTRVYIPAVNYLLLVRNLFILADISLEAFDEDEVSTFLLPRLIDSIATCNLKKEFPGLSKEPGALKVFSLAQHIIQYLLRYDGVLHYGNQELLKYDARCNEMKIELFRLQKECKKRRKIIERQQRCIYNGVSPSSFQKCLFCEKTFLNETFLSSHLLRRHHKVTKDRFYTTKESQTQTNESFDINTQENNQEKEWVISHEFIHRFDECQNVIKDQHDEIGVLKEQLRLHFQEENKLISQERFWQAKFERLRSAHAADLKNLKGVSQENDTLTVNTDSPIKEDEGGSLEKEKLAHGSSFELDSPLSKSIEDSRIVHNEKKDFKHFDSVNDDKENRFSASFKSIKSSESYIEIPLESNLAPTPKETLDESLMSLGIPPESTGIDTYTFIKSMKTLGDKLNQDEELYAIKHHFDDKINEVMKTNPQSEKKASSLTPSESDRSSPVSTFLSETRSPNHFGQELEITQKYGSHTNLTQHEGFTRTKPWTSIKNSNAFHHRDSSLFVESKRRQGIYASDSELLKGRGMSKSMLSSISSRVSVPLQSYHKVREASMELKKSESYCKEPPETSLHPFSEPCPEKKVSRNSNVIQIISHESSKPSPKDPIKDVIKERGFITVELPTPAPRRVVSEKRDYLEKNEDERTSSYSESCSQNESIESPSFQSEDTEYDIDEDNNSWSSPRAIKIKPPRPGSKIDVLKSIIEGQMKKNRSSLSINEECGDLEDDEEVGMQSLSESDLIG